MSMLTGKCDFFDEVNMIGKLEDYLGDKADIYVDDIKIPNNTEKDLVLYYPFTVGHGCYSEEHNDVHLARYSYIDYEEYDRLEYMLNSVKKYYKKCKRNKTEFTFDGFWNSVYAWSNQNEELFMEMFDRVKEDGDKANILGLSLPYFQIYSRKRFYDMLIEHGYDEYFAHKWAYDRIKKLWYERHYGE